MMKYSLEKIEEFANGIAQFSEPAIMIRQLLGDLAHAHRAVETLILMNELSPFTLDVSGQDEFYLHGAYEVDGKSINECLLKYKSLLEETK